MLPKSNKDSSSSLVAEASKQLQVEVQSTFINKSIESLGNILFYLSHLLLTSFWLFLIETIDATPKLIAWSSILNNKISIVELDTKQEFANFDGVKLNKKDGNLTISLLIKILCLFLQDTATGHMWKRLQTHNTSFLSIIPLTSLRS